MSIGQHVRTTCDKHTSCKQLRGVIVDIRAGNRWKYQVKWNNGRTDWMTENGLSVTKEINR